MIIACPACATRYEVPESAIGTSGRTVRCAKCRHSWLAMAEADARNEPEPASAAERASDEAAGADPEEAAGENTAAATEPRLAGRQPPPAAAQERVRDLVPPDLDEEPSDAPPPARRRGRLRMLTWAAALFAILAGGTIAAASYWGLPDWVPVQRTAFAAVQPGLKLDFPAERQERRQLPNGTEFFGASGTITNLEREAVQVPPILIVLRDGRDRIVYSWEVAPPKRRLAPGESITVREAITDVPRSARVAEIGWKPV